MSEVLIPQLTRTDGRKEAAGSSLPITSGESEATSDFMPSEIQTSAVDLFSVTHCMQSDLKMIQLSGGINNDGGNWLL